MKLLSSVKKVWKSRHIFVSFPEYINFTYYHPAFSNLLSILFILLANFLVGPVIKLTIEGAIVMGVVKEAGPPLPRPPPLAPWWP